MSRRTFAVLMVLIVSAIMVREVWASVGEGDPLFERIKDKVYKGEWVSEHNINAEYIQKLCSKEHIDEIPYVGIRISDAHITGELDLNDIQVTFPLHFKDCVFDSNMYLLGAKVRSLRFENTTTKKIAADRLVVDGSVYMRDKFEAKDMVSLLNSQIGGNLDCRNGKFINIGGVALILEGSEIDGSVFLNHGFHALGQVSMNRAKIGKSLNCEGGTFNEGGTPKYALSAERLHVVESVFLRSGFEAKGRVSLLKSKMAHLDCCDANFISTGDNEEIVLELEGATIQGNVFLCKGWQKKGFVAKGQVCLDSARIEGSLFCDGSFKNAAGKHAMVARGLNVGGNADIRKGFVAGGTVDLTSATIESQFYCTGKFVVNDGNAIDATSLTVKKDLLFQDGFGAKGKVNLYNSKIHGTLEWIDVNSPKEIELDLRHAKIGRLLDDPNSWPAQDKLLIHGLDYNDIPELYVVDSGGRILRSV